MDERDSRIVPYVPREEETGGDEARLEVQATRREVVQVPLRRIGAAGAEHDEVAKLAAVGGGRTAGGHIEDLGKPFSPQAQPCLLAMQVDAEGKLSELHTKKKKSGLDTSAPELQATWTDVLDDASSTDWMTMS